MSFENSAIDPSNDISLVFKYLHEGMVWEDCLRHSKNQRRAFQIILIRQCARYRSRPCGCNRKVAGSEMIITAGGVYHVILIY